MEQRCQGTLQVWAEPFTRLRLPKIFNLRTDPYEFADVTSNTYYEWYLFHLSLLHRACPVADQVTEPLREIPPRRNRSPLAIGEAMRLRQSTAPANGPDPPGGVGGASPRSAQRSRCYLEELIDGRSGGTQPHRFEVRATSDSHFAWISTR